MAACIYTDITTSPRLTTMILDNDRATRDCFEQQSSVGVLKALGYRGTPRAS